MDCMLRSKRYGIMADAYIFIPSSWLMWYLLLREKDWGWAGGRG